MPQSLTALLYRRTNRTLQKIGRNLERAARDSEMAAAKEALKVARQLSSGPHTAAVLRRMDHPYARGHPSPLLDAAIINVRTGRFKEAWRIVAPRRVGSGLRTRLVNDSPEAAFMGGTRLMVPRPIEKRIREAVERVRARDLIRGIERAAKR